SQLAHPNQQHPLRDVDDHGHGRGIVDRAFGLVEQKLDLGLRPLGVKGQYYLVEGLLFVHGEDASREAVHRDDFELAVQLHHADLGVFEQVQRAVAIVIHMSNLRDRSTPPDFIYTKQAGERPWEVTRRKAGGPTNWPRSFQEPRDRSPKMSGNSLD